MIFTSRLLLGLALVWMLVAGCARQDNPTPQAHVYRFDSSPQTVSFYKIGAVDTLVLRISATYLADGKMSSRTYESFSYYGGTNSQSTTVERYQYNVAGQLEQKDWLATAPGAGFEILYLRRKYTYTSGGKLSTFALEDFTGFSTIKSVIEKYTYNPDGTYETIKKDSVTGRSISQNYKFFVDRNGRDSLVQSKDMTSGQWLDQTGYVYDAAGRFSQLRGHTGLPNGSVGRTIIEFFNYQTCKVPAIMFTAQLGQLYTGRQEPYNYIYYMVSDPNGIAARINGGLIFGEYELDNSSGPAIQVNSAGYLKTLRYTNINNNTSRPVLNKYRLEFDY